MTPSFTTCFGYELLTFGNNIGWCKISKQFETLKLSHFEISEIDSIVPRLEPIPTCANLLISNFFIKQQCGSTAAIKVGQIGNPLQLVIQVTRFSQ